MIQLASKVVWRFSGGVGRERQATIRRSSGLISLFPVIKEIALRKLLLLQSISLPPDPVRKIAAKSPNGDLRLEFTYENGLAFYSSIVS